MRRPVPATDWVAHHRRHRPDATALVDDGSKQALSYRDLDEEVGRIAAWMRNAGVEAGDRVAFLGVNTTDVFEILFACARIRAIYVPLNWRLAVPELEFIIGDIGPALLIHDNEMAAIAELLDVSRQLQLGDDYAMAKASSDPTTVGPSVTSLDDPWAVLYTSGTTGRPKGAILTHGNFFWNAVNCIEAVGLDSTSTVLNVFPTFHVAGLNMFATPCLYLGARVVNLRQFDPETVLDWLGGGEITHFAAVAAVYQILMDHPGWAEADLSRVRRWDSGGAPLPVAVLQRYADRGVLICQGMGLTETGPAVFINDEGHVLSRRESVGRAVRHTEVKVVDDLGRDVPTGEIGELWVRGPNVSPGYWERPEANSEAFTDGWLHTGDAARIDADGYAYIVDRWKDMFISGGENVYPAEVEQVLHHHPNVKDVAVIGVPDERWGEVGRAIVVLHDPFDFAGDQLLAFCDEKLARYKIPKQVVTVDELPRNATGKVLKRQLREEAG